jgi:uncharacterized membrane protein YhaH (DUF805 family)
VKDLIPGLFSFNGRMGRAEFWLLLIAVGVVSGGVLLVVSMIVLSMVDARTAEALAPVHAAAKLITQVLGIWPSLAILTKRGHDRDRPAVLSIGLWVVAQVFFTIGYFAPGVSFLGFLILLYFFIDYGCMPGTPGRNRYDGVAKSRSAAHDVLRAAETFD